MSVVRLIAVLFLLAAPASAGTVYVPLLAPEEPAAASFKTLIRLTNHGDGAATVTTVRMRGTVDGTRDRAEPVRHRVPAGTTKVLTTGSLPGLLEVRAPANVAVSAELRNGELPGPREVYGSVPVIHSGNVEPAGATAWLQGIRRTTSGVRTHLGLVNLGHRESTCDVELRGPAGDRLLAVDELPLPALSHALFEDALAVAGQDQAGEVHARVSCSRPFYAYLAMSEAGNGETVFVRPSATGTSTLKPPAEPSNDAPSETGGKSLVFARKGLVHQPTRRDPTWTHDIRVPANTDFRKVVVDVDVTPGPWYAPEPHKAHSLFWIHRGGTWPKWDRNMIGYANAYGPGSNQIKVAHNMGVAGRPYPKLTERFQLRPGRTYHFRYEYDAAGGKIRLAVSQGGKVLFRSTDRARVKKIRSDGSGEFMLYFGHTPHPKGSGYGPERATFGWKYSNPRVEFVR